MTGPSDYYAPSFEVPDSPGTAVAEQPEAASSQRDKTVVVTGAAGLVGTHVCEQLARSGWKVRAIVRNTARAAQRLGHLPLEIRTGDIRNVADMRSALAGAGSLV